MTLEDYNRISKSMLIRITSLYTWSDTPLDLIVHLQSIGYKYIVENEDPFAARDIIVNRPGIVVVWCFFQQVVLLKHHLSERTEDTRPAPTDAYTKVLYSNQNYQKFFPERMNLYSICYYNRKADACNAVSYYKSSDGCSYGLWIADGVLFLKYAALFRYSEDLI